MTRINTLEAQLKVYQILVQSYRHTKMARNIEIMNGTNTKNKKPRALHLQKGPHVHGPGSKMEYL